MRMNIETTTVAIVVVFFALDLSKWVFRTYSFLGYKIYFCEFYKLI